VWQAGVNERTVFGVAPIQLEGLQRASIGGTPIHIIHNINLASVGQESLAS